MDCSDQLAQAISVFLGILLVISELLPFAKRLQSNGLIHALVAAFPVKKSDDDDDDLETHASLVPRQV